MGGEITIIYLQKKLIAHPPAVAGEKKLRILFWNVQGLATKITQVREYLSEFEVILLVETFVESKNEIKMQNMLPKKYNWMWTPANRDLTRGRPWGGALIGVKEGVEIESHWSDEKLSCSGVNIRLPSGKEYSLLNIYNRKGIKTIQQKVSMQIEDNKEKKCIALGDWNAKIGEMGQRKEMYDEKEGEQRKTQDVTINEEGRRFIELINGVGLSILNGNKKGDWNGAITHIGYRSQSVIDYGCANESAWNDVEEFRVGDCSLSDHFPLEITLSEQAQNTERAAEWKMIHKVNRENRVQYQRDLERRNIAGEQSWNSIANSMLAAAPKIKVRTERKEPHWWNGNCFMARKEVKKHRLMARRTGDYAMYREARRKYKTCIKLSKQSAIDKQLRELESITDISSGWKYLKRNAQKSQQSKLPKKEDLVEHFKTLLGAEESIVKERMAVEVQPIRIEDSEFEQCLQELKEKKAAGIDQVSAEMIKFSDVRTKNEIRRIIEDCLGGAPIPEEWKDARIHPLYKKGNPELAQNYRGISIVNVVYKMYAQIICSRLSRYCEENELLPDCQNGFRKRRSTIDCIYVLNHCIQSTLSKGRQLYAAFIDFKAAFDTVNRSRLIVKLQLMGIPEYIVNAISEIYRDTVYHIEGEHFKTNKGLRQGCPLSPLLFALYTSDLEVVLRNWQSGGVIVRRQKIYMLAYADDIVMLSYTPEEMKDMINCLMRYSS